MTNPVYQIELTSENHMYCYQYLLAPLCHHCIASVNEELWGLQKSIDISKQCENIATEFPHQAKMIK